MVAAGERILCSLKHLLKIRVVYISGMKKMKYIIVIPCLILVAVSAVVLKECHTNSAMSDNSAEEQSAEKQQMWAVAETDAEENEDTETDTLSEEELVSSDNALFDRACLLNSLYECKLNLEVRNRDLLRGVQDKQSADSAAKSCEAALAERKVLEHLIGRLFPMPEEVYEAVLYSGSYAISAEMTVDEECKRLLTAVVPAYGSAELEAVLKGRPKATMSVEELKSFLAETEKLLQEMVRLCTEEKAAEGLYFCYPDVTELSCRWERINHLRRSLTRSELSLYRESLNRMVLNLQPLMQCYKQDGAVRDDVDACARLLPPLRRAVMAATSETYESQESVAALAVETAGKIFALLQRIRDAESARGVLPELKQAVEHLCALQKEHSMFFSSADALVWPDILELRLLHREITQAADALHAENNCYGCPEPERLLKAMVQDWIPNLASE